MATSSRQLFVPRSRAANTGRSCAGARRGVAPICCAFGLVGCCAEGEPFADSGTSGFADGTFDTESRANTCRPRRRLRRFLDFGLSCRVASGACPLPDRVSAGRSETRPADGPRLPSEAKSPDVPAPGASTPESGSSTCVFLLAPREPERTLHALSFFVDVTVAGPAAITTP